MQRLKNPSRFVSDTSKPSILTLAVLLLGFVGVGAGIVVYSHAATGPSGVAMPVGDLSGWHQVFADDFNTSSIDPHWSIYNGKYGGGVAHYASNTHVYNTGGSMHLLGQTDASSYNGTQWYTGGACLCAGSDSWLNVNDVMVTYRWRVTNTNLVTQYDPHYAFLRWPKSEIWPQDGEEDFQEGSLAANASAGLYMHHASSTGTDVNTPQTNYAYDPTQWHTATYYRSGYHINLVIDGVQKFDYTGSATDLPATMKHVVFQQECNYSGCPTGGTEDVEIDWVAVYVPGSTTVSPTPTATPVTITPIMTASPSPTPVASSDTTPPSFSTIAPANGSSYKHTVTLTAAASDSSGVAMMTITVDGKTIATAQSDYISTNWNSGNNRAASGAHTVVYTAKDTAGNTATTTRTIYVK